MSESRLEVPIFNTEDCGGAGLEVREVNHVVYDLLLFLLVQKVHLLAKIAINARY